ncbi:Ankyrin repeat-containing protein [Cynara cardunculus var. scolymus]|uniref:Ankyrin repeat-containing protein n=1 Tax=Cynara cardunculus var. scolymus TaxID=59895 RepID=A0A118K7A7_CYNCS|nr:Ankyrin repeat-containing protein [Cynara cardunculus var. scolymus]
MKAPSERGLPPATPRATTYRKKMSKLVTGKRDDTPLHTASRAGNINAVMEILGECDEEEELISLLAKKNYAGETPLYVAAEYGYVDLVRLLIDQCDVATASIKANNGFDALHIAAKQGDLEILKVLMEAHPELSMTVDMSNTTALHTAAMQGNIEVMNYLLEIESSLASIARSNGKTALHSSARNGHVRVVKALLEKAPGISARIDKKGQTALHMAAKGKNHEVVEELIKADPALINIVDAKGNTALHIATRKGRVQIVKILLARGETNTQVVNRSNETALDTAQKMGHPEIGCILQEHGVPSAQALKPPSTPARELKQTVSDIKHEVHHQLEHTLQTRRRVQGICKHLNKMQAEGLNNAINSTTVVAVLIATVAFAAIFTVPGQYADDPNDIPKGRGRGSNVGGGNRKQSEEANDGDNQQANVASLRAYIGCVSGTRVHRGRGAREMASDLRDGYRNVDYGVDFGSNVLLGDHASDRNFEYEKFEKERE